jgi:hypothetical protein
LKNTGQILPGALTGGSILWAIYMMMNFMLTFKVSI